MPVVMPDGGRPGAGAVGGPVVFFKRQGADAVVDDLPMYQVFRVQEGHTGQVGEGRGHHVVVLPHAYHVGVGVVGVKDRVLIVHE